MSSHFLSYDYLARNKATLDKVSVSTPAQFSVPCWRAGKAYKQSQKINRQRQTALNHAFIAIERVEKKRVRKPYLQPSQRRQQKLNAKAAA